MDKSLTRPLRISCNNNKFFHVIVNNTKKYRTSKQFEYDCAKVSLHLAAPEIRQARNLCSNLRQMQFQENDIRTRLAR